MAARSPGGLAGPTGGPGRLPRGAGRTPGRAATRNRRGLPPSPGGLSREGSPLYLSPGAPAFPGLHPGGADLRLGPGGPAGFRDEFLLRHLAGGFGTRAGRAGRTRLAPPDPRAARRNAGYFDEWRLRGQPDRPPGGSRASDLRGPPAGRALRDRAAPRLGGPRG